MNANRKRAILAAQKIRLVSDPKPADRKLTPEERKAMFAPKSAMLAPQQLQGPEWVTAWRSVSRITYGLTAFTAFLFGGIIAGESKKGIKP